ncbi:hypothetical protein PJ985_07985 [Streptomyces sp. ACA25]|uniref:hypothetical protein n=1 Tax=Streptomyces sp. ACA25 TaxID=3022596 RepID=UPI002307FAE2|nr:hypothetical protein [Streptomyces sp. ACA25]MDB1087504.1 hypothetical protein [Streptomyces sp. ACA25]
MNSHFTLGGDMRLARTVTLSAGTAALLIVTTACGTSDAKPAAADKADGGAAEERSQSSVAEALLASATKSKEATSVSFETTMTVSEDAESFSFTMAGGLSWDPVAMDVTLDMGDMMALMGESGPSELHVRWVDDVMYMGGSVFEEPLDGKQWAKFDLAVAAEEMNDAELDQLMSRVDEMSQSPAEQLAMMLESPDVEWKGEEELDGVATNRYRGVLATDELDEDSFELLTPEERREAEELIDGLTEAGVEEIEVDVWVDERDYPVRIDMAMSAAGQAEILYSTRYSDYGSSLTVEHPPAAEVVDVGELDGAGMWGGGAGAGAGDTGMEGLEGMEDWDDEDWDAWLAEQDENDY